MGIFLKRKILNLQSFNLYVSREQFRYICCDKSAEYVFD